MSTFCLWTWRWQSLSVPLYHGFALTNFCHRWSIWRTERWSDSLIRLASSGFSWIIGVNCSTVLLIKTYRWFIDWVFLIEVASQLEHIDPLQLVIIVHARKCMILRHACSSIFQSQQCIILQCKDADMCLNSTLNHQSTTFWSTAMKTWRPNDLHLIRVVLQNLKQLLSNCKKIKKNQVLRHLTASIAIFFQRCSIAIGKSSSTYSVGWGLKKIKSNMFCALQHGHNSGHGWPCTMPFKCFPGFQCH